MRQGRIKLTCGSLFWHEVGTGETLVFLHGSWWDSNQWLAVMQDLSQEFHCIAPDLLGFGESETGPLPYSIALESECLARFMATLRESRFYLVTHSLGAWVGLRYALNYPQQVKGLIVIEPEGLQPPGLSSRWRQAQWLTHRLSPWPFLLRLGAPLARRLGHGSTIQTWQQQRHRLKQHPAACRILFQRRAAELRAELVQDHLSQLQMPSLALVGDAASKTGQRLTRAFVEATGPEAHYQTLATTPLALGLEPQAVAQTIRQFVSTADGRYDLTTTVLERRFNDLGSSLTTESA